jgi:beta-glucosidase
MRKTRDVLAGLLICLLLLALSGGRAQAQKVSPGRTAASRPTPAYLNPNLPLDVRVKDLVSRMTLEEKASQMVNKARAIPRLGVPAYDWWSEALHGDARAGRATVFPQAIGLAATWNTNLLHQIAVAISNEGRAKYEWNQLSGGKLGNRGLDFWAPNINIFRDPRWGRGQETYGEDPYLASQLAVAFVTGMQGNNPLYFRTIATPKHFDVHSGPEMIRHVFDARISARALEGTYLPAFRAAIMQGKADSVMCAYSAVDGVPACASKLLLQDILRKAWHFHGYVVSDCGAIRDIWLNHHYAPDLVHAVADAVNAGTDLSCGNEFLEVPAAVREGLLSEAAVNRAVTRLFRARFRLGLFDPPSRVPYAHTPLSEIDSPAHRRLALQAARESIVLLKNENHTLPFGANVHSIAVVGPEANLLAPLLGDYHGTPQDPVTPLAGMIRRFAGHALLLYAQGSKLVGLLPIPVPASALSPAATARDRSIGGLTGEYFNNTDLRGSPVLTRTDLSVDFDWQGVRPSPELSKGTFSVRWTGMFTPPAPGTYELGVRIGRCDGNCRPGPRDGFKLYLDGKLFAQRSSTPGLMIPITFTTAAPHVIRLEYFHRNAGAPAGIKFLWNAPAAALRDQALAAAKHADVVVAFLGLDSRLESEENPAMNLPGFYGGDRTRLSLPKTQEALLQALGTTGKPIVVVLMSGSALAVNWAKAHAAAILEAWYPGEEGGTAIAETLAGANNPAGRLPVTFYKSVSQLPPFADYSMKNRTYRFFHGTPLFPFGFGLSYSHFAYTDLRLSSESLTAGAPLDVNVTVRNTSARAGGEVVEVYLSFPPSPGAPIRALRAFGRIHLQAGQSEEVHFRLSPRQLSEVNVAGEPVIEPGTYHLSVGGGQPGSGLPTLAATFTVRGSLALPR